MADITYHARDDYAATQALIKLVQLARSIDSDFTFSPSNTQEIVQQGLTLTGDTAAAEQALDAITGLVQQ